MNSSSKNEFFHSQRYFTYLGNLNQKVPVRSFGWLSFTILVVTFFALAAIKPTLVTIAQLNKEIKDKTEASQKLQQKINSIVAAQKTYAKNVNLLPLLDEVLPEKNEFPQVAIFLEELASSSGVELRSLGFEKVFTKKTASVENKDVNLSSLLLNISLGVAGEYANLKEFLKGLESSRRVIKVESVSFSQSKKAESWELSLQFTGNAFFAEITEAK